MGGRVIRGHQRRMVPLSAIVSPRHSPKAGWRVDCACGWSDGPHSRRLDGERSYANHVLSAAPICGKCGQVKALREMSKSAMGTCKRCRTAAVRAWAAANPSEWERSKRASHLRRKYGLSIAEVEEMLARQGGVCAICGSAGPDSRGFRPHIDHCHKSGKVRGVLCGRCNAGLGSFCDNTATLRAAIAYLEVNQLGRFEVPDA